MSDFKNWEELEQFLSDPEDIHTSVSYHSWAFSKSYMDCADNCCGDYFDSLQDAVEAVKSYSGGKLELVSKDE